MAALRRSTHQSQQHTAYWARQQSGTLTYVALGDSAGVGVGVEDPQSSYVGIVADRLAQATGQSIRVVNFSVSGAKALDVLRDQVPQLSTVNHAHFVTCVVGGNDVAWTRRFRAPQFAQTIDAIAARLPPGAVMASTPHFGHWPFTGRGRQANHAIAGAARAHGHPVADIFTATSDLSMKAYLRTFSQDYFHPNETGYRIWADALWRQIEPHALVHGTAVPH